MLGIIGAEVDKDSKQQKRDEARQAKLLKKREASARSYHSATRFNLLEYAGPAVVLLLLAAFALFPLIVPRMRVMAEAELDVFKEIPVGSTVQNLVPVNERFFKAETKENSVEAEYTGGMYLLVTEHESADAGLSVWKNFWYDNLPDDFQMSYVAPGMGEHLVMGQREDKSYFLSWMNGKFEFSMTAPNKARLNDLIEASNYIDHKGEEGYLTGPRPFIWRLVYQYEWLFCLLIFIAELLFMGLIFGGGIAIATRRPPKGTEQISRDELRQRLLALNNDNAAMRIEEVKPYHLALRLRLEQPEYSEMFSEQGLRKLYQLDLYIRKNGTVGALETTGELRWDRAHLPHMAKYRWSFARGIVLYSLHKSRRYEWDADELRFKETHRMDFDVDDFKRPVVQAIIASGWTYKPMLIKPLLRG